MPKLELEQAPAGRGEKLKIWGGVGVGGSSIIAGIILDQPLLAALIGPGILALGVSETLYQGTSRKYRNLNDR